ncbi:MAG: TonB-dependent receptor plug domain-containing protein [Bacteroidales bacterium]|nr:TonB-dependent receptor plug domain-containing protein [Bacteroidales bacterium]
MKKLIIQIIISSIFVFYSTFLLFGQEKVIHGKVTTFESIPLIGASIKVKSTKEVVYSDTLGLFTVSCLPKDKLKVTARGFSNQNVKIKEKIKYVLVNLKLKPDPESREIAIGYGHVKDKDKLYAISSLNEKDMDFSQYNDIYDIIRGRFPGVQISGGEIIIRGISTIMGSYAALLVVDGVVVSESSFASIPTTDIASINVLKGAAAAIYGVRGSNGVVIVETKKGGKNQ